MTSVKNNVQYNKFAQGIFIVKAKNSSFNSDFSGLPRRLPDNKGTIYATDKALKYCIRKYLLDRNKGQVFVWRRYDGNSEPVTLEDNYKKFIEELKKFNQIDKNYQVDKDESKNDIIKNLLKALDVRLFGATFAKKSQKEEEKRNVSITGTTQISYGINKFNEHIYYNNDILSPYKDDPKDKQRTIGNETKTLEAHYVYDFIINPNNLIDDLEFLPEIERKDLLLSESDISNFKEAMRKGVSYVNSTSKIGCESEFFMYIEMNASKDTGKIQSYILPLMKDFIKIEKNENKTKIDLKDLFDVLDSKYKDHIESIELYYDDSTTTIGGIKDVGKIKPSIIKTL